jgi:hypothetical protein
VLSCDETCGVVSSGGIPTPGQGCQYANSSQSSVTRSQQNFIVEVATVDSAGQPQTTYLYTGDRWQQSPDGVSGLCDPLCDIALVS